MNLCDAAELKGLLNRHGFRFSRSLGQNFLIDPQIPRRIAQASGADGRTGVLEIGPGVGALTRELCRRAGRVVAVELDARLEPVLGETMAEFDNFTLLQGDVLKLDLPRLAEESFPGLTPVVCANLPYNITTPVLTRLVESRIFTAMTVMVQREVARRIAAEPGTPDYGAFSVFMQYYTQPELVFEVPPESFLPAPKVWSAVLHCRVREAPAVGTACGEAFFFRVVRSAFAQRRKTLVNSLSSGLPHTKEQIARAVVSCGLPPDVRGERLGLEAFAALADRLWETPA